MYRIRSWHPEPADEREQAEAEVEVAELSGVPRVERNPRLGLERV
jgi:hypothetical protein